MTGRAAAARALSCPRQHVKRFCAERVADLAPSARERSRQLYDERMHFRHWRGDTQWAFYGTFFNNGAA